MSPQEKENRKYPAEYPCFCGGTEKRQEGDNFYKFSYKCKKCGHISYGVRAFVFDDENLDKDLEWETIAGKGRMLVKFVNGKYVLVEKKC